MATEALRSNDRILQKALELFSEKGYDATSVREICEAAGITKPTLYHFYGSKEGVYRAIVEGALERFRADMVRALGDEGTLRDRLVRMARAYVDATLREPDLARFIMALIHNPPRSAPGHRLRGLLPGHPRPRWRARWTRRSRAGEIAPGADRRPPPRLHGRAGRGDARPPAGGAAGADARARRHARRHRPRRLDAAAARRSSAPRRRRTDSRKAEMTRRALFALPLVLAAASVARRAPVAGPGRRPRAREEPDRRCAASPTATACAAARSRRERTRCRRSASTATSSATRTRASSTAPTSTSSRPSSCRPSVRSPRTCGTATGRVAPDAVELQPRQGDPRRRLRGAPRRRERPHRAPGRRRCARSSPTTPTSSPSSR